MTDYQIKLKYLFYPYLTISLGFIMGYTFLHWLLVIRFDLFMPSELFITTGLPIILCWIPALIWMNNRIQLLALYRKRGNVPLFYFTIVAIGLCVPTILTQKYLIIRTGKLTELQNVDELSIQPLTKYYSIKDYREDKQQASFYSRHWLNRLYRDSLTFETYIVCPVYAIGVKHEGVPVFWLGVKYQIQYNRDSSTDQQESWAADFLAHVQNQYRDKNLQKFKYLEHLEDNGGSYGGYLAAINASREIKIKNATIFEGKNEPFESRLGNELLWAVLSYLIIFGIWIIMLLIPNLDKEYTENISLGRDKKGGEA